VKYNISNTSNKKEDPEFLVKYQKGFEPPVL
jgi:hypothetical protein